MPELQGSQGMWMSEQILLYGFLQIFKGLCGAQMLNVEFSDFL